MATIRFVFDIRDGDTAPDEAQLEEQMQTLLRGWSEAVEAELGTVTAPPLLLIDGQRVEVRVNGVPWMELDRATGELIEP